MQDQLGHFSIDLTVDTYGRWLRKGAPDAVDRLDDAPPCQRRHCSQSTATPSRPECSVSVSGGQLPTLILTGPLTGTRLVPVAMPESARFRVAVHVLTLLAHETGRSLTSAYIAGSVNTSPVVVRRILRQLARAGLVSSTEGAGGGTVLKRGPARITLLDVHRAVEPGDLFGETRRPPNPRCLVGRSVQKVLDGHAERLRAALGNQMDQITVADVLAGVRRRKRA